MGTTVFSGAPLVQKLVYDNSGNPYAVIATSSNLYIYNNLDTTPNLLSTQSVATIGLTGNINHMDAACNGTVIFVMVTDSNGNVNDTPHWNKYTIGSGWGTWNAMFSSFYNPPNAQSYNVVALDIASDGNPCVLVPDFVKDKGTVYAQVYFSYHNGTSWQTLELVTTTANNDHQILGLMAVGAISSTVVASYFDVTTSTPYYRTRSSGSWGTATSESQPANVSSISVSHNLIAYDGSNSRWGKNGTGMTRNGSIISGLSAAYGLFKFTGATYVNSIPYIMYSLSSDSTILYLTYNDGGWTETQVEDEAGTITSGHLAYNYNYTGNLPTTFIPYLYVINSTSVVYGEYSLSTGITMDVTAGSYTYTGTAASLEVGHELPAAAGSYSYTGTNAALSKGRILSVDAGSYAFTGSDATFEIGHVLQAEAGSYTYTGTDVTLVVTQPAVLDAEAGSYTYTGTDAALSKGYTLTAEAGSYTYTGTDAALLKGLQLSVEAGSYTYTGTDAILLKSLVLQAAAGSYALTGTDVTFFSGAVLIAEAGSYVLAGTDVTFTIWSPAILDAEPGSYTLTGTDVSLEYGNILSAEPGSYALTGSAVELLWGHQLPVTVGSYALTGFDASFNKGYMLQALTGSYVLTGVAAQLLNSHLLNAVAGIYNYIGIDGELLVGRILAATAGSYTLTGTDILFELARVLTAEAGSYTLTGTSVMLLIVGVILNVPAERILSITLEDRLLEILSDDRSLEILEEDRTWRI